MTLKPVPSAGWPERPAVRITAVAAIAAATLVLSLWAALRPSLPGDVIVARWVQAHPFPCAYEVARLVNALGSAPGAIFLSGTLAGYLVWRGFSRQAAVVVLTLPIRLLPSVLKQLVASPRPTPELLTVLEFRSDPGFPSGHAFGAVLLFGLIWWLTPLLARRRLVQHAVRVLALGLVLATGYSRVLVGAHWPSDVLGGYLWGLLILLVLLRIASVWLGYARLWDTGRSGGPEARWRV